MTQGVITSVLLFVSKKNITSNKILALAIIAFCLLSSKILLNTLGLTQLQYFSYFPLGIEYALAPLLYFYVVSLITPNFKFSKKHLWHFLPFFIFQSYAFFVYFNVVWLASFTDKNQLVNNFYYHQIKDIEEYLTVFSVGGYLLAGFFKLKKYRRELNETISDSTFPTFNWLMKVFIFSSILGVILLINEFLDFFFGYKNTHYFHWQIFYLFNAFLIYYLGFIGYQQPDFQIDEFKHTQTTNKTTSLNKEKQQ